MSLPKGWVTARLDEVGEVILGQSPPGSSYNRERAGLPFFQGKAEFGSLRPVIKKWTTDPKKLASADDVLLSVRAPVGPTNLASCDCSIGRGLAAIHLCGGIDPHYVLWGLRATADLLASQATGTTFGAISGSQVRSHRLPVAPVAEQRRIVTAIEEQVSRIDASSGLLLEVMKRLRALRRAVYGTAVANSWPELQLGALLREPLRNGHSAKASHNGTGIRTLTLTAVTKGDFSEQNTKLTVADPRRVRQLWLKEGDVLVERSNTPELVGTAALYRGPSDWVIYPDLLIRVRVTEAILPEYLEIVLKSPPARRYFKNAAQGIAGSMPKIDQQAVEGLDVPLPPPDVQSEIVTRVERALSLIDITQLSVDQMLSRGETLRGAILRDAFAGKLVPQDPSDEPASALLKRIAAERAAQPKRKSPKRRSSQRASMATR